MATEDSLISFWLREQRAPLGRPKVSKEVALRKAKADNVPQDVLQAIESAYETGGWREKPQTSSGTLLRTKLVDDTFGDGTTQLLGDYLHFSSNKSGVGAEDRLRKAQLELEIRMKSKGVNLSDFLAASDRAPIERI